MEKWKPWLTFDIFLHDTGRNNSSPLWTSPLQAAVTSELMRQGTAIRSLVGQQKIAQKLPTGIEHKPRRLRLGLG